ncbi:ABC transporter permease [Streptomyces carpaticus]|uniref:Putative spermidine/putrescine transport system permease protein n=1 Tax=Streptomyces harbinensis TaxID=1176198 RepID=A0A1I6R1Q3_9ACTN|nr:MULTISPECIES: ABC transporter permease [Streptomyces]MCK1817936.1 ABC transporter permease [Streptomyces sp. XM4011]UWM47834.1 ABC transporter permease [Streptomyces carpaticus]SFS58550.1 putative spermidine/putrescine transport system permease protein [Streptomyces harbinensis]
MRSGPVARIGWAVLLTVLYLFLLAPVIIVFIESFDTSTYLRFPPQGFSLEPYRQVFANPDFQAGLKVSAVTAATTTLLALLCGVPAALALTRLRFRGRGAVEAAFLSPLLVPNIVLGLALLILFAPIPLTDTYWGLILAHLGVTIPYVVRTVTAALAGADPRAEEAAATLGAGPFTVFRRVTLPAIRPGLFSGGIIAFLLSFDETVISLFVSGHTVRPLPVAVLQYVEYRSDPSIAALSVCLVLLSVVAVVLVERGLGLRRSLRP